MNREDIKAFLDQRIDEKVTMLGLETPELDADFHLTGSGVFDSMDFFGLVTDMEQEFNIEIDFTEKDPGVFTTYHGFIECVLETGMSE